MKELQNITNSDKDISQKTSEPNNVTTVCSGNQSENLDNIYIKQKYKLSKNIAIMSLLKKKQIPLEDIINPSNKISVRKEDNLEVLVNI